jgi:hypothetical protein
LGNRAKPFNDDLDLLVLICGKISVESNLLDDTTFPMRSPQARPPVETP